MILVLNKDITNDQKSHIRNTLLDKGCFVRETDDGGLNLIGALGKSNLDVAFLKKPARSSNRNPHNHALQTGQQTVAFGGHTGANRQCAGRRRAHRDHCRSLRH